MLKEVREEQKPSGPQLPPRHPSDRVACLLRPGWARAADTSANPVQLCFPAKAKGPAHAPRRSHVSLPD